MKSKIILCLITFTSIYILFNRNDWKQNKVLVWDKSGYYIYLPALFVYDDIEELNFYPKINEQYHLSRNTEWYAIYDQPETGRKLNKYAIGVSLFQLPFFFMAHLFTKVTGDYPADGYSSYYQLFLCLANVFWVMIGLLILRNLLKRYFGDLTVGITILFIALGTNLYNYTSFDFGLSHTYSFFLYAAFLNVMDQWYRQERRSHLLLLGVISGLIIITRSTNIIILLIPLFWGNERISTWDQKIKLFRRHTIILIVSIILCCAVLMIQMSYWKYITGHWIYFSYEGESFDFTKPEIWKGLFSYRKGWFIYTPLAFIALFGFIPLWKKQRKWIPALLVYFVVTIYIIFSWQNWYYGGSFGCRALIESLVVLSFPLAALLDWIQIQNWLVKFCSSVIFILCLSLNIWQTYQFNIGALPTDGINKSFYWKVLFKLHPSEEDWKSLRD